MYSSGSNHLSAYYFGYILRGMFIAIFGLYSAQAAAVAKCPQPDGTVIYQNMPCGTSERGEEFVTASNERAEAARPNAEARDVMHDLLAIKSAMEPIRVALSQYFAEQGHFPGRKDTLQRSIAGKPVRLDSVWSDVGFSLNPAVPYVASTITYVPLKASRSGVAQSFVLVVAMKGEAPVELNGFPAIP